MWKNKHIIIALLIAPVLAIIAWFSVDYFVAERPHSARSGASYPLVAKPNCRRPSGECDLVNEDVRLTVVVTQLDAGGFDVVLESVFSLSQAVIGKANGGIDDKTPTVLVAAGADGRQWQGRVAGAIDTNSRLRVAVMANGSTYYAEIPVTFFFNYVPKQARSEP